VITPAQMRTLCEVANRRIDFVAMEIRLMFALADIRRGFERFRRDITIRFSAMVIAQAAIVMAAMHVMLAHR